MTEKTEGKGKGAQNWSTRAGTIKADSVTAIEGKDALRATVVNGEGKESTVEAYGQKNMDALNAAAESGKPHVFRGPFYMKGGESHLMINMVKEQAEPKAEMTEEEKAARAEERKQANAEAKASRDASRVMVDAGSVEIGGKIEKDGKSQEINHIGAAFEKDGKSVAYAYFGEVGAEMAAKAAEAEAKAAEKAAAEEDMAPTP